MIVLCSLLFGGLLSACTPAPKLDNTEWQLVERNGKKLPLSIQVTLNFKDGQATGKAPCNGYGAGYTQDGFNLIFEEFYSTLMYCDGVMEIETEFLTTYNSVKSFKMENDQLKLLDESGAVLLVFGGPMPYPSLEGSSWKATMFGEMVLPEDLEVSLTFSEGKINGTAACNTYFADYTQTGGELTLGSLAITEMYCDQAGVMEAEAAFLTSLEKVRKFEFQMGTLVLMDENGGALIYLKP